ncbi:hypothetical protein JAAARDRAFT_37733 [Jaapia argillacea MUCL 33604]|uniref:FAD dependent oxidoreductase domain-containing protein n=1 Tax=Jaapia argillacea MUCL 33604 TaxID=933084 RepID=A0A067PK67_9AGAM|nr:hypothetical protein JAAARDRAFT_37733 [Jaapia argillacea MUCL 33604]
MSTEKVLIVGAGCFGLSTAFHLLKRGYVDVTVIDRSNVLPAPDAASTDLNKIVRTSYSDIFYARFAKEAIDVWKDEKEWDDAYHECGVLVLNPGDHAYTGSSYQNDISLGSRLTNLEGGSSIGGVFPPGVQTAFPSTTSGYLNQDGGWAYAAKGVSLLMSKVIALGGQVMAGKPVKRLVRKDGVTSGVECVDGTVLSADIVVIATGSWTSATFSELDLSTMCLATGQSVATIQLTTKEAERYRKCPVVLDFKSGFYVFPPNEDGIVKMAIHAAGYTNVPQSSIPSELTPDRTISTPRTSQSHGDEGLLIPKEMVQVLRNHLEEVYPELARKPFGGTRLCWYLDTPDEDWVIGPHPDDPSLFFATGGSGHAYKFLPVVGRLVADSIQGKLDPSLQAKFAINRKNATQTHSRFPYEVKPLEVAQLCTPADLLP